MSKNPLIGKVKALEERVAQLELNHEVLVENHNRVVGMVAAIIEALQPPEEKNAIIL